MGNRLINSLRSTLLWVRVSLYAALSTGHAKGSVQKVQPVLILGDGIVEFDRGVKLGYFPSPFCLSGYIHL